MGKKKNSRYVIDTREKRPLKLPATRGKTVTKKLETGDYSIVGYEDVIVVEYKSLGDWLSWISPSGKKRFDSQMERLKNMRHACVLVGARLGCTKFTSPVTPQQSVKGTLRVTSMGVSVLHAPDPARAGWMCKEYLDMCRFLYDEQEIKFE